MFQKKLLAFICFAGVACWSPVWSGDNLSQLSKFELEYFKYFFGRENLRLVSDYVYESDDPFYDDDFFGVF